MTKLEQYLSSMSNLAAGRARKILTTTLNYRAHGVMARHEVVEMLVERGGIPYGEPTLETFTQWRARFHKNRDRSADLRTVTVAGIKLPSADWEMERFHREMLAHGMSSSPMLPLATKTEYWFPYEREGETWETRITKTEYDYALFLVNQRGSQ